MVLICSYATYSWLTISQGISARLIVAREELLMLKLFPNKLIVILPDCGISLGKKLVIVTTWRNVKLIQTLCILSWFQLHEVVRTRAIAKWATNNFPMLNMVYMAFCLVLCDDLNLSNPQITLALFLLLFYIIEYLVLYKIFCVRGRPIIFYLLICLSIYCILIKQA